MMSNPLSSALPASPQFELIAPAGDWNCAKAAVENGADGIYFGLQTGLNARARAVNFTVEELPELMTFLRRRGVKGYLALNTLVFPRELVQAESLIRRAINSGVDALIVQDLGLAGLAHRVCPDLPLHASTQMTLSSPECIEQARSLGIRRVVLPRELSLDEIAEIHRQTGVELEAFVHGALCISYSGQCLASLALGGRSGNRGQCAQTCRLKYELIATEQQFPTDETDVKSAPHRFIDDKRYLLSPCDLAAFDCLPRLIAAGVTSFKIEGRLKEADYVAVVTRFYRRALDESIAGRDPSFAPEEVAELEAAFSRGFSHGWLDGPNHQNLVPGDSSTNRGVYLGEVRSVRGNRVTLALVSSLRRGIGIVFEGDREHGNEQGGRVFEIFRPERPSNSFSRPQPKSHRPDSFSRRPPRSIEGEVTGGLVEVTFRHGSIDFSKIGPGTKVWKTDDPQLSKKWRQFTQNEDPLRRIPLDLTVIAVLGRPLRLSGRTATGATCSLESTEVLQQAEKHILEEETLRAQLGRLGGSIYELRNLEAKIVGDSMIPFSELGKLRHEMIEQLDASLPTLKLLPLPSNSGLVAIHEEIRREKATEKPLPLIPQLYVLCRSLEQVEAASTRNVGGLIVDFQDIECYADALRIARQSGVSCFFATPRIHRVGGRAFSERIEKWQPDGVLARNLAELHCFAEKNLPVVADFSLNAVNELTVSELLHRGAMRVTAGFDLNNRTLHDLLEEAPIGRIEILLHSHIPMFHTAHCLFCAELSTGTSAADCGGPCRRYAVRIRDRVGCEHVLTADADCRNTLYHVMAQSGADMVARLLERGLRHFRLELLEENAVQTRALIDLYQFLLVGRISLNDLWGRLKSLLPAGVARGTWAVSPKRDTSSKRDASEIPEKGKKWSGRERDDRKSS